MPAFKITLSSFQQVQEFVSYAVTQPYQVLVGNEYQQINGKDFMGMFSLDYTHPVQVILDCSGDECARFQQDVARLLD